MSDRRTIARRASVAIAGVFITLGPTVAAAAASMSPPSPAATPLAIHIVPWHVGALFALLVATAQLLRRYAKLRHRQIRSTALLFALYLFALTIGEAFRMLGRFGFAGQMFWTADLLETFITINLAALIVIELLLRLIRIKPATIVTDLVIGAAYVVSVVHEMSKMHVNTTGLITTSAVASGVLSFSLAPTIGNILGGIALQLDNSVSEGDWIQLDANTQGKIKAIRWRHTVVETRNWDTIIVPNVTLLSASITILGKRTDQPLQRRYWIYFNVDFRHHPSDVIAAVNDGLQASPIPNVAAEPAPHCICFDFARDGRDSMGYYAVRYWLTDLAVDDPTTSVVRERLYTALERAAIPLALPASAVMLSLDDAEHTANKTRREYVRRVELLRHLELFEHLNEDEIQHLARHMIYAPFARNEPITQQGHEAHWLYILARGEAEVTFADSHGVSRRVGAICAPDFFGEMAVMTGAPRAATVIATRACDCYRLEKEAFRKIITERAAVAQALTKVLMQRKVGLHHVQHEHDADAEHFEAARERLVRQIETFFGLR